MSNVPNNNNKIQIESVRFRSAASESTMQSIGGAVNQLFDDRDAEIANLTAAVNAEAAARIAADNAIGARITAIGTLPQKVGQGTYDTTGFLVAGAPIHVNFHSDGANFYMEIWYTNANTADGVDFYVTAGNKLTRKTTASIGVGWSANRYPVYTYNRNDGKIYWTIWEQYAP